MVARTWLQHALPMPFGLKLAEYAAALHRSRQRLRRLRREGLALQFGGAAGTLAALGDKGLVVAEQLAQGAAAAAARSALAHPSRPHRGSRVRVRDPRRQLRQDRARRLADDADRCRRSLRARRRRPRRLLDHAAQAQSRWPPPARWAPRPWRRNLAATIFAAQVQDHERSAGPWHAEWPTLPTLMLVTSGALAAIVDIAEGLEVDAARMRANLDATHGLIMAEAVTDGAGRKDRQERRPSSRSRPPASAPSPRRSICATCWRPIARSPRISTPDETCGIVRADGLSRRFAGPDRPAARSASSMSLPGLTRQSS